MNALYSCTGTITVLGLSLLTYGVTTSSPLLFFQGLYLTYMGVHMTFGIWNELRQEL